MDRQQVITVLESLANGTDPSTGARIPSDTFHSADTVRALFAAASLLKNARNGNTKFVAAGTPWSSEEDSRLTQEFENRMTIAQIALQHGRTSAAITSRLVKLGKIQATPTSARPTTPAPRTQ
ncbi:MAG TPA: hypothetical protein VKB93_12170 [Thermoanaerobaculia bacterium]|nr:hypothetical protein [Thermoanaerobaculia bacterium]